VKAILHELAAVACALVVVGAAIGSGRDKGVLVPPPEATAENFLRALTKHRWAQARAHLAADLRATPSSELAAIEKSLEEARGCVENVQGEDADRMGETATARASIEFTSARMDLHLPVRRENGLWKVASLDPLRQAVTGP
jgi:hypothetical protein